LGSSLGTAGAGARAIAPSRDAATWPFAVNSPWNTPLGSGAQYGASGDTCTRGISDPALTTDVNAGQWSHPTYVARAVDPRWSIKVGGTVVARITAPAGVTPALPTFAQDSGTDAHLHIVDPTHRFVDELWRARVNAATHTIVADSHSRNSLVGSGVGAGGERAYGGSAIGGLMRVSELRASRIPHALALALPDDHQRLGFVWPATAQDSNADTAYTGTVPMGSLVAIPPTVDVTRLGLSPAGLAVAHALQDYGAYDVDSSGNLTLYAEPPAESLVDPIRGDLPTLATLLRCVTNNSASTPGGGGRPRAPLAPAIK